MIPEFLLVKIDGIHIIVPATPGSITYDPEKKKYVTKEFDFEFINSASVPSALLDQLKELEENK